jgi:FG-GAP-like repeat
MDRIGEHGRRWTVLGGLAAASLSLASCNLGSRPTTYQAGGLETIGADLDGDGDTDLVAFDIDRIEVLVNRGDGTFDVTSEPQYRYIQKGALGDVDEDEIVDLVYLGGVSSPSGPGSFLRRGDGIGGFGVEQVLLPRSEANPQQDISLDDLDGDGSFSAPVVASLPFPQPFHTAEAVVEDLSGDGNPDLVLAGHTLIAEAGVHGSTVAVAFGDGTGRYPEGTIHEANPEHVGSACDTAVADLDADSDLDIAVASYDTPTLGVLLNNGVGGFSAAAELPVLDGAAACPYESWGGVAIADVDGDSHADVVVAPTLETNTGGDAKSHEGHAAVWFGNGAGSFGDPHHLASTGAVRFVGDLNGDTRPEVVLTNRRARTTEVFPNRLNGRPNH